MQIGRDGLGTGFQVSRVGVVARCAGGDYRSIICAIVVAGSISLRLEAAEPPQSGNDAALGTNIALHCSYTWSMAPNAFSDESWGGGMCNDAGDALQLTDGELAERSWFDKRMVGWWYERTELIVTIDLGGIRPIAEVAFHISSEKEGHRVPRWTGVFVSDDNESFYAAGEVDRASALRQWRKQEGGGNGAWIRATGIRAKGRYLALSLNSACLYMDEIRVFPGELKLSDAALPKTKVRDCTRNSLYPFYLFGKGAVAANVLTPIQLNSPPGDPGGKLDITLDLPAGVTLVSPSPAEKPQAVNIFDSPYTRHVLKNVSQLYLGSILATGTWSKIRLAALPTCKGMEALEQVVEVETVTIPDTPLFKRLLMSSTFGDFAYWQGWPDVVENYKRLGLNLFAPFGHTDYYFNLIANAQSEVVARAMVASAKAAGLKTGGQFSPFCNGVIESLGKLHDGDRAVSLEGKALPSYFCPRVYLRDQENEKGELGQMAAGASLDLDLFCFDSEPSWGSAQVCACPKCEALWAEFLKNRAPQLSALTEKEVWKDKEKNRAYVPLMQEFWNDFYCRDLWGAFRRRMTETVRSRQSRRHKLFETLTFGTASKKPFELILYNHPWGLDAITGTAQPMGNSGLFRALWDTRVVDAAFRDWYMPDIAQMGDEIHAIRNALPEGCPLYVCDTYGSGGSITFEVPSIEVRHRLLEIFLNGGKGVLIWTCKGTDTADYMRIAEVVRMLAPVEDLIVQGTPIPLDSFDAPSGIRVRGMQHGNEALILVSRYDDESAADVPVRIKAGRFVSARSITPLDTAIQTGIDHGSFVVHFTGQDEDAVQVFKLRK